MQMGQAQRPVQDAIRRGGFMATGQAKIIDNAIMGLHATATPRRRWAWPNPAGVVPLRTVPTAHTRGAA